MSLIRSPKTPRKQIDDALEKAGWIVQDANAANVHVGRGVAIREFPHQDGTGFADYLLYVSSFVFRQAAAIATGVAQKTVPLAGLRQFAIPLPPLAEQFRIVSEIERRLSLIDEIESPSRPT